MAEKQKLTKAEFIGKCRDLAENLTRSHHKLNEMSHLSHQHWLYMNGANDMAQKLLKDKYEIKDEENG